MSNFNRKNRFRNATLAALAIASLTAPAARGAIFDWEANPGYSGTFNDPTNWNDGVNGLGTSGTPTSGDEVSFQNAQTTPYTVGFTGNITTQKFEVVSDQINFDLNGNQWTSQIPDAAPFDIGGSTPGSAWRIGAVASSSATVVFSSTTAGGTMNTPNSPAGTYRSLVIGNTSGNPTSVTLSNALGNGITWQHQGNLSITGTSEFNVDAGSVFSSNYSVFYSIGNYGNPVGQTPALNVRNGGQFLLTQPTYSFVVSAGYDLGHINVESGGLFDAPFTNPSIGFLNPGYVDVKTGGTFNVQDAQVGLYHFYVGAAFHSTVTVDGATSTAKARNMTLGNATDLGANDTGEVVLQNSSNMAVSQNMIINVRFASAASLPKNTLTLNTGTLTMGSVGNAGQIQDGGVIRGTGLIKKATGSPNFTITVGTTNDHGTPLDTSDDITDGELRPGDTSATPAIGTLTITDGSLTETSGGTTYLNVATGGVADLIAIVDGTATLNGALNYSPVGVWTPTWQTTYTFLTADSIAFAPTSDNMAALMSSYGYAPGVYFYGVNNLDNGQQALQLIIPEPTSLGLLAVGVSGLLLRRRRQNQN